MEANMLGPASERAGATPSLCQPRKRHDSPTLVRSEHLTGSSALGRKKEIEATGVLRRRNHPWFSKKPLRFAEVLHSYCFTKGERDNTGLLPLYGKVNGKRRPVP